MGSHPHTETGTGWLSWSHQHTETDKSLNWLVDLVAFTHLYKHTPQLASCLSHTNTLTYPLIVWLLGSYSHADTDISLNLLGDSIKP